MRWLFLIMLVLNLSYIVWETLNTSQKPVLANVSPLPDVPTILLANEVDAESALAAVASIKEEEPVGAESAGDELAATESLKDESAIEAMQVSTEDVPPVNEANDERGGQLETAQIKTPDACFTLGPFRELDTLRALTRNLKGYVEEVGFRSRDEKEPSLFWVYLPALADKVQVEKVGQQLKAKKIKDFYIIRSGDKKNGISLGQFRNKAGAYRLAEKVANLNFNVEVEPMFKVYTLYWLDYRLVDGGSIPEAVMAEYLTDKISRLSRSCASLSIERH